MQELTGVALLTKSAEPVLTYCSETFAVSRVDGELFWGLEVLGGRGSVTKRTEGGAEGAASLTEVETADLFV